MSRKKRLWLPDHFYHVVSRGNRRDPLFQDDRDFRAFFYNMKELSEKSPFEISSYCFMTNHYHLQIRSPEVQLSQIMSRLNKGYANYYNTRYNLCGHVFEKRFHAEPISNPYGNFVVSHYIHMNPVRANMVESPEDYPWSSYRYFQSSKLKASLKNIPFFTPKANLELFKGSRENYVTAFQALNDNRKVLDNPKNPNSRRKFYFTANIPYLANQREGAISDMQMKIGNHIYF
ncbi:transposase [Falsibacillus pallidus]|uniref:transposase n=1 Tax=Falsibacillus pallidus TaxID=493781 RepID=UPI003D96D5AB